MQNTSTFINRELSWLEFNQRVLDQAQYQKVPVLERLKFLAITASNMDEFFMVRVGGLQIQESKGLQQKDFSGLTPSQQLQLIYDRVNQIIRDQYACFLEQIEPTLNAEGIEHVLVKSASARHRETLSRFFHENIYPVVSPMDIDPEGEFPVLANLGLHLSVRMSSGESEHPYRFAIVPLGRVLSRFITLPRDKGYSYALLEDVVSEFMDQYYPGKRIEECVAFRVTRNADVSVREDSAADLMHGMEEVLDWRRSADFVRLEISSQASEITIDFLKQHLELVDRDVFRIPGPLDLSSMMYLSDIEGFPGLRDTPWISQKSPSIDPTKSMFSQIAEKDILLSHPYESFEPVVRFIEEASGDPDVLAIKQVLYRTSRNSPIVRALKAAAERGKYVTAIVELKARFDEQRNIEWARELEKAGVQVIYGVRGLKTHAKVCIVVRREASGIVRYVHFGTGNYNEATARLYSDVSYLTCNESLGRDASSFINAITGYSQPLPYEQLDSAPLGLRKKVLSLIRAETSNRKVGQKAYIAGKMNALVDPEVIEALYEASQAGVIIRLNVRGICCLRPGVPGLSENISVVSIVDRFLEHARILYFYHGGDDKVFISSADWMSRSFDRRVELLVPIEEKVSKLRLTSLLEGYFKDNQNAWYLQPDGKYQRIEPVSGQSKYRVQKHLYENAVQAIKDAEHAARTTFEPHTAAGL
jgi:polyphosphate kinase